MLFRSPVQVKVLPISDKFQEYAKQVADTLKAKGVRAEIDDRNEKIGKKIRDTELMKVPYMLIVGEKEMTDGKVSVRRQGRGDLGSQSLAEFSTTICSEILDRQLE